MNSSEGTIRPAGGDVPRGYEHHHLADSGVAGNARGALDVRANSRRVAVWKVRWPVCDFTRWILLRASQPDF